MPVGDSATRGEPGNEEGEIFHISFDISHFAIGSHALSLIVE
jgi:hypothetical protein